MTERQLSKFLQDILDTIIDTEYPYIRVSDFKNGLINLETFHYNTTEKTVETSISWSIPSVREFLEVAFGVFCENL